MDHQSAGLLKIGTQAVAHAALDPFECEMAITVKQRAFAGFWFMVAAALLIVPIFNSTVPSSQFLDFFIWLLLSPLLITGLVGSLLGASILDAQRAGSGWRAALRGLSVAVISYLLYAIGLSAWDGATQGVSALGKRSRECSYGA